MGYTTDFEGSLKLSKELTTEQMDYINNLGNTRRMKRDVTKLMKMFKGKFGYPGVPETSTPEEIYGIDGEYFVNSNDLDDSGQTHDESIINYNVAPGQKGFMEKVTLNPDCGVNGLSLPRT